MDCDAISTNASAHPIRISETENALQIVPVGIRGAGLYSPATMGSQIWHETEFAVSTSEEGRRRIGDNFFFFRITAIIGAKKWDGSWKGMYKSRKSSSSVRLGCVTACLYTKGNNADCIVLEG